MSAILFSHKLHKNYRKIYNIITEISKDRFKELEGIYVEKYEEPVIEKDNGVLQAEIDKLKEENKDLADSNKALQAEIDKLKEEKENTNKEESPKKSKAKSDESVEDGKVQE